MGLSLPPPISYLRTGGIVSSSIFPDLPSSPISQHLLIKNQEYRWMMTYHSLSPGKIAIVIVQSLSRVGLSVTPWTAGGCKVSLPSLSLWVCSNSCPLSQWWHPTILSSCPRSFPVPGSFPWSQFITSGGQSIGASALASILPMNIQGWFPLGLTGWISLQSKGLSRVFSNTTVQKHQFFSTQPPLWSSSYIHTWLLKKL